MELSKNIWIGAGDHFLLFGVDTPEGPPTPQTPLPVPQPRQKAYQSAPFWILHPSAYSSRPETELLQSYGAKIEIRTPMHTWRTRHPRLACTAPHCSSFLQKCTEYLMLAQSWKNREKAAPLAWLTPRPVFECVCLWLLDMSTNPPFYPICSIRVAIDCAPLNCHLRAGCGQLKAEDSNDKIQSSVKVAQK